MAGTVTGSTILDIKNTFSEKLKAITLTINNLCNANCEHCYLNYFSKKGYVSEKVIDKIFESDAERVVITGKEPFYDRKSVDILKSILERGEKTGKKVSVITNGINIGLMELYYLSKFENLDISIHSADGLYRTREQFEKITENLEMLKSENIRNVNILSVIDNKTINNVNGIIDFSKKYPNVKRVLFSLFLKTYRGKTYSVKEVDLKSVLNSMKKSENFVQEAKAYLLLDMYHFVESALSVGEIERHVTMSGIENKIRFIKTPPTLMGIIRVTHEGLVMTSYDALHTENYAKYSSKIESIESPDNYYKNIVSRFTPFTYQTVAI